MSKKQQQSQPLLAFESDDALAPVSSGRKPRTREEELERLEAICHAIRESFASLDWLAQRQVARLDKIEAEIARLKGAKHQ